MTYTIKGSGTFGVRKPVSLTLSINFGRLNLVSRVSYHEISFPCASSDVDSGSWTWTIKTLGHQIFTDKSSPSGTSFCFFLAIYIHKLGTAGTKYLGNGSKGDTVDWFRADETLIELITPWNHYPISSRCWKVGNRTLYQRLIIIVNCGSFYLVWCSEACALALQHIFFVYTSAVSIVASFFPSDDVVLSSSPYLL